MGLKTGCSFETRQLESEHALLNMFGYCLVIAYVLLLMRALSRAAHARTVAASEVLSADELICLTRTSRRYKLRANPTAAEALLAVAGLGGHLKRNGPPGWRVLSRGYGKLLDYMEGFHAAQQEM